MAEYELVCEIFNQCSGNQMRDVDFQEISVEEVARISHIPCRKIFFLAEEDLSEGAAWVLYSSARRYSSQAYCSQTREYSSEEYVSEYRVFSVYRCVSFMILPRCAKACRSLSALRFRSEPLWYSKSVYLI